MSTASGVSFDKVCRILGVETPLPEYKFALAIGRQWRFDWAWPKYRIALEVEGGVHMRGRHQRAAGFIEDMSKYNHAQLDGWLLLRVIPSQLQSTATIDMIRAAIARRRGN